MSPRVAELLFDSATAGQAAGARGFGYTSRSLLYGIGDVNVDLLLVDGGYQLTIVQGQIVKGHPGEPVRGIAVHLGDNDCRTDDFGQFSVTLMGRHATTLHLEIDGEDITCPLPEAVTS